MAELLAECEYCGNKWVIISYLSEMKLKPICEKCKEYKAIKVKRITEESGDVFGYHKNEKK